jgi:hypothetical protein
MPDGSSKTEPNARRRSTLVAAGMLLLALALVVIYTNRGAFFSPLALVVVAAIGLAALLLQLRLRPDLASSIRGPLWLNGIGVFFALGAVFADFLHLNSALTLIAALAAVVSFAISGIIVLSALRKPQV